MFFSGVNILARTNIVTIFTGYLIASSGSFADNATKYAFPYTRYDHSDDKNRLHSTDTMNVAISNLITNSFVLLSCPGFSYSIIPYISPFNIESMVYPTKYEPTGNSSAPIKSTSPPISVEYFGPNHIADNINGTNPKLNYRFTTLNPKNLDNTIPNAINSADNIIFFVFDIKISPFF